MAITTLKNTTNPPISIIDLIEFTILVDNIFPKSLNEITSEYIFKLSILSFLFFIFQNLKIKATVKHESK